MGKKTRDSDGAITLHESEFAIETVPFHKVGDVALAKEILKKLVDQYPGYLWRVSVKDDKGQGIVEIINVTVSDELSTNADYAYVLHLTTIYEDPNLKCVMRAGGEILERAGLDRTMFKGQKITHVEGVPDNHQPIFN